MDYVDLNFYLNSKWVSTVASIWIQCTSGSLYTFSIYSQTLKSTQHYDQSTLDIVSVSKDIGANVGVLAGLLYDFFATSSTTGPWLVHFLGSAQCFLGYFLMWAAVAGVLPPVPVPVMCLFMFVAAHAQSYFNTSNVVTGVHNFPNYSGTIVGIMKGFLGLSGAILIQVYRTIFNNKPMSYLLMLALLPPVNTLLLMWFVRIHKTHEGEERKYLNLFSFMALVVAAYLMVVIILENILSLQLLVRIFVLIVLIGLLASLLCIASKAHERGSSSVSENLLDEGSLLIVEPSPLDTEKVDARHTRTNTNNQRTLQLGENLNLFQAVQTVNFWILFVSMACGMGSGLATVNNIGQIGESLGYASHETSSLVSLWSIWNFLGRFGAGYVSDYFLHTRGWARPLFMVITLIIMSIGHVVIAYGLPGALYVGSILVGICYGSQWSLMPTITSEIFGVGNLGSIFNTITIAGPVGSYIFSVRVVGYIYDKEASEGNTCIGTHCFMFPFLIMAAAAVLGSLAALVLFLRTKNFYSQVVLSRIHIS
ncbi:protein NUCLEAR FUSION DEFECTIVE 4-like [Gastrolobium bilobum]|uniref:protein NUCLEAR FUSION DEFECTIVE 4-like n=1 Tax=Gastrolobium bilobum TaxID=150636 RepID=UPI002AAFE3C4|nr:protein NUCLEAR FUSION DEFECTIVE 4-like [Gastrolobium bilobum]